VSAKSTSSGMVRRQTIFGKARTIAGPYGLSTVFLLLRPPKTVKSMLTHKLKQEHAALATVHYPYASR